MTTLESVARAVCPIPYGDDTAAIQAAIDAMQPEIDDVFQRGVVAGLEAAAQGWIPYNGEMWTNATFIRQIDPTTIKDIDTPE
jgi:hypothetical protein